MKMTFSTGTIKTCTGGMYSVEKELYHSYIAGPLGWRVWACGIVMRICGGSAKKMQVWNRQASYSDVNGVEFRGLAHGALSRIRRAAGVLSHKIAASIPLVVHETGIHLMDDLSVRSARTQPVKMLMSTVANLPVGSFSLHFVSASMILDAKTADTSVFFK